MSRAVTCDHILFNECIEFFRKKNEESIIFFSGKSHSYILTGFKIKSIWEFDNFKIYPSEEVILPGAYRSFISKVDNPDWVGTHNSHLFSVALASILTFITNKPCRAPRDGYYNKREELSKDEKIEYALVNPILCAGPGAIHTNLSEVILKKLYDETRNFVKLLYDVPYSTYNLIMQSVRLIQLSVVNKKEDFGLGYLLLVSSIESIAQIAIKRDKVKEKTPKYLTEKAKNNPEIQEILKLYENERGNNQYLNKRFVMYIEKFAPIDEWNSYVLHPNYEIVGDTHSWITNKMWYEKYPDDLSNEEIKKVLGDVYSYRSNFVHQGKQPPHKTPNSYTKFFEEYDIYENGEYKTFLLLNYDALLGISKHSILNWSKSLIKN